MRVSPRAREREGAVVLVSELHRLPGPMPSGAMSVESKSNRDADRGGEDKIFNLDRKE